MAPQTGIEVPIIMYHSILNDPSQQGKYVISPDTLESDMRYLKDNGYQTITIRELIAYVKDSAPLPPRPVVLTFDDGYLNNFAYVPPLLEKYEQCAVISVVGEFCDMFSETEDHSLGYAHMTWQDVKELAKTGYVEIGNHTYFMHHNGTGSRKGAAMMRGESLDDYIQAFSEDLLSLQHALSENSGVIPVTFTYPYGFISAESVEIIKELGFEASLSCNEVVNIITHDSDCLYGLGRFNRPAGISTQTFMNNILSSGV